jgi:hypothetical protein
MTKSMHKLARKGGRTPFDILRDYETGDRHQKDQNAILFREFVSAFHGLRQLVWSPKLKNLLACKQVSDEEISLHEDERLTTFICELNLHQWRVVRRSHRATLLSLAEKSPSEIPYFLHRILNPSPS